MKIDRRFPPTWSADRDRLYWREWAAVRRADRGADRHALHVKALGYDKSHVRFNDLDFSKVLNAFREVSKPADLLSQIEAIDGRKQLLIFSIQRAARKLSLDVIVAAAQPIGELEAIRVSLSRQLAQRKSAAPI